MRKCVGALMVQANLMVLMNIDSSFKSKLSFSTSACEKQKKLFFLNKTAFKLTIAP